MPRYDFEFISHYDGQSDYRIWIDGKPDTRLCVADRRCFYADGSKVLKAELDAFNAMRRAEHAKAVAKFGRDEIGDFREYTV